jgi:hypothetical protein
LERLNNVEQSFEHIMQAPCKVCLSLHGTRRRHEPLNGVDTFADEVLHRHLSTPGTRPLPRRFQSSFPEPTHL